MSYKHGKKINVHPGAVLKELIERHHVRQTQLAKAIDMSQPYISDVINGRRDMTATLVNCLLPWVFLLEAG